MVLVPDHARLVVEASVPNKDVGFVAAGQTAEIKVETFTFTRYGLIQGRVLDVSRDSLASNAPLAAQASDESASDKNPDEKPQENSGYVAHIALDRTSMMTEAGTVQLGPGMHVTTEIKTGKRTVMSYLLSPVLRYRQESLRER